MANLDHHPDIFVNRGISDSPPPNLKEAKTKPLLKYQIETRRIPENQDLFEKKLDDAVESFFDKMVSRNFEVNINGQSQG